MFVEIFEIKIYSPFNILSDYEIPYYQWQTIRLSVFITFFFFSIRSILLGGVKLYPIQFLDYYIKFFTLTAIIVFIKIDIIKNEYLIILSLIVISFSPHLAARPKYRKYFIK